MALGYHGDGKLFSYIATDRISATNGDNLLHVVGADNIGVGPNALNSISTGEHNVALGVDGLDGLTTGDDHTAVGFRALRRTVSGDFNTAVGSFALSENVGGSRNTGIGGNTLIGLNFQGNDNTALGYDAGSSLASGDDDNICIGNIGVATNNGIIRIGTSGTHARSYQAGIVGVTTDVNDAIAVLVDSTGNLGTVSSARRYKENIEELDGKHAIEIITRLEPVKFNYKARTGQEYGVIADDVLAVLPEIVIFQDGKVESVQYHKLHGFYLAGIKQLAAQNVELQEQMAQMQAQIDALA